MTAQADVSQATVLTLVADLLPQPGALLEILHRIQGHFGYVPTETVPIIAKALNLSRAEVHGVVTFYHEFRESPPGMHVVKLCQAEACQAMGSADLTQHAERKLGTKLGATSPDGRFTLEAIYCLGHCACSPAGMIDDAPAGRLTTKRFDALIQALGASR